VSPIFLYNKFTYIAQVQVSDIGQAINQYFTECRQLISQYSQQCVLGRMLCPHLSQATLSDTK